MDKLTQILTNIKEKEKHTSKVRGRIELQIPVEITVPALTQTVRTFETGYFFPEQPTIITPQVENVDLYSSITGNSLLVIRADSYLDENVTLTLNVLIIGNGWKK